MKDNSINAVVKRKLNELGDRLSFKARIPSEYDCA